MLEIAGGIVLAVLLLWLISSLPEVFWVTVWFGLCIGGLLTLWALAIWVKVGT